MSESWYKVTWIDDKDSYKSEQCLVSFDEYAYPMRYYSTGYSKDTPPYPAHYMWVEWILEEELLVEFISDEEATLYILRGYI